MLQITLSLSLFRCCYCTQVHSISKSGSGKESRLNEHHGLGQQASPALSRRKEPHASSKPEYDQSKSVFILLERKEKKRKEKRGLQQRQRLFKESEKECAAQWPKAVDGPFKVFFGLVWFLFWRERANCKLFRQPFPYMPDVVLARLAR